MNMLTVWLLLLLSIVHPCSVNIDKAAKDKIFSLQGRIKSDSPHFASLVGAPMCMI